MYELLPLLLTHVVVLSKPLLPIRQDPIVKHNFRHKDCPCELLQRSSCFGSCHNISNGRQRRSVRKLTCELVESPRVVREFIYRTIAPVELSRPGHNLLLFSFLVLNRDWLLDYRTPLDLLQAARSFILIVRLG